MLLGAVLSDTVLLNSPTTTERDRVASSYLEELLGSTRIAFGREMFEELRRRPRVSAADLVTRDLKEYELDGGRTLSVAQIETVGSALHDALDELLEAVDALRDRHDYLLAALMVTDIVAPSTVLLVAGPEQLVEQRLRPPARRRRDRPAGRDEPQEAGRAGPAGRGRPGDQQAASASP